MADRPTDYFLFGDRVGDSGLDTLNIEAIRDRSSRHDWAIQPHRHPSHHQLLLFTEGNATIRIEDKMLRPAAPCVVIHPAQAVHEIGYVILTSYLALQAIDDSLIEAARSLGARRRTILWRLILPLAAPGILAGAVLIFVPVVGSFMEPRLLGGRLGTYYGTVIEDQFVAVFNWPLGAALSFILLAVVLAILAAASPILKRART